VGTGGQKLARVAERELSVKKRKRGLRSRFTVHWKEGLRLVKTKEGTGKNLANCATRKMQIQKGGEQKGRRPNVRMGSGGKEKNVVGRVPWKAPG